MTPPEEGRTSPQKEAFFVLFAVLVGLALFLALSFLTFGIPFLVLGLAALIALYVGFMRFLDRKLAGKTPPDSVKDRAEE